MLCNSHWLVSCWTVHILLFISSQRAYADNVGTLERIRTGYKQTVTSMESIWCRYEKSFYPPIGRSPSKRVHDWAWVHGQIHYSSPETPIPDGVSGSFWQSESDGVLWSVDDQERLIRKQRNLSGTRWITDFNPGRILGMYVNIGDVHVPQLNLPTLLDTRELTLRGIEYVNGEACWRVDFNYPGIVAKHDFPVSVWFDPKVGFLPRQITTWISSTGEPWTETVTEFTLVDRVGTTEKYHFPKTVKYQWDLQSQLMEISEVQVNTDLAPELFVPRVPDGYSILDLDDPVQLKAAKDRRMEKLRAEHRANRTDIKEIQKSRKINGSPLHSARPRVTNYFAWILSIGGMLIISAVSMLTLNRRLR